MICALLLAANRAYGPLLCFWDEPDNYLALDEVRALCHDAAPRVPEELVASSSRLRTILRRFERFSDENTLVLQRRNHLEPTTVRKLASFKFMVTCRRFDHSRRSERTCTWASIEPALPLRAARRTDANRQTLRTDFTFAHRRPRGSCKFFGRRDGWIRPCEAFQVAHLAEMQRCDQTHNGPSSWLIDCDGERGSVLRR